MRSHFPDRWCQPWCDVGHGVWARVGHCFTCEDAGFSEFEWKVQCPVAVHLDGQVVSERFRCRQCGCRLRVGREVRPFELLSYTRL